MRKRTLRSRSRSQRSGQLPSRGLANELANELGNGDTFLAREAPEPFVEIFRDPDVQLFAGLFQGHGCIIHGNLSRHQGRDSVVPCRISRRSRKKKENMKFTPEKSRFPQTFVGFWRPKNGDVVRGVLIDAFDGEFGKTFMVELGKNEYGPANNVNVETRDRETKEKYERSAKSGDVIGINEKANLKGLDKFVGHALNIRCLGSSKNAQGGETFEFDTDLGSKAPKKEEKKGASAPAPKSA